jgi:hypothetical protein
MPAAGKLSKNYSYHAFTHILTRQESMLHHQSGSVSGKVTLSATRHQKAGEALVPAGALIRLNRCHALLARCKSHHELQQ